jgi:hypothetical protein
MPSLAIDRDPLLVEALGALDKGGALTATRLATLWRRRCS